MKSCAEIFILVELVEIQTMEILWVDTGIIGSSR